MAWSLDFFAAEKLAKQGKPVRRVGWTDYWFIYDKGMWFRKDATGLHLIKATDYGEAEFRARDWTDEAFNSNPCSAAPAFNSTPIVYGDWNDGKINFAAPPPPGFPDISA
jgi:hypothetical protein